MERVNKVKRDKFISEAVAVLQETANKQGYGRISKETLSLMVQRYVQNFHPPKFPGKRKRPHLMVIK